MGNLSALLVTYANSRGRACAAVPHVAKAFGFAACVPLVVMADSDPSSEGDKISFSETQLRQMVAEEASNAVQEFIQRTGASMGGGQTTAAPATGITTHPSTLLACGTAFCSE